jgi:hypothetical protein
MSKATKTNLFIYLSFILITAIGSLYGQSIQAQYQFLRVWDFQNILVLLLAVPFLFYQSKAGLPDFYEEKTTKQSKWLIPVLIGAIFGILDIFVIKYLLHPEPYTELPPFLQPFPYSVCLFFSGALEIEVFYRLIPLTLILLFGKWYKDGKYLDTFFWVGAVLTAIREPLEQMPSGAAWLVIYSLLSGFLMNLLQAIYYKKSGFLASLALRLGHYLFWHILLGIYVEFFELAQK